jgi:hypothetical protein
MPKLRIVNVTLRDAFSDLARVHHTHRPSISAGKICVVECNGKIVRLAARGTSSKDTLEIDLKTRIALGLKSWNETVEVSIKPARWWDEVLWTLKASSPMPRIAAWLGLVSLGLGVVGVLLGLLSIYLALLLAP